MVETPGPQSQAKGTNGAADFGPKKLPNIKYINGFKIGNISPLQTYYLSGLKKP